MKTKDLDLNKIVDLELVKANNFDSSSDSEVCDNDGNCHNENITNEICTISKSVEECNTVYNSAFGHVQVDNCNNTHIGTKIIANNVNFVGPKYTRIHNIKHTKTLKGLFCSVSLLAVITIVVLVLLVYTDKTKSKENKWLVDRATWGGVEARSCTPFTPYSYLILIDQTDGEYCTTLEQCSLYMRAIQKQQMKDDTNRTGEMLPDINYSFVIGGDGRVYEGRSWSCQCQDEKKHSRFMSYTVRIAFIGDYFSDNKNHNLSETQIQSLRDIIDIGVNGTFISLYNDIAPECSYSGVRRPGDNIFKTLFEVNIIKSIDVQEKLCEPVTRLFKNLSSV